MGDKRGRCHNACRADCLDACGGMGGLFDSQEMGGPGGDEADGENSHHVGRFDVRPAFLHSVGVADCSFCGGTVFV